MLFVDMFLTILAEVTSVNAFEINPYIRVAYKDSVLTSFFHIKKRIIFDYELIYLKQGSLTFKYNDVTYDCKAGQFIFIRPEISHSFRVGTKALNQPHIHFDMVYDSLSRHIPVCFKDKSELSDEEKMFIRKDIFKGYPIYPFVNFSDEKKALELFYKAIGGLENDYLVRKAALTEIISMLVADNFPHCFSENNASYGVANLIKDYIDAAQGLTMSLDDFESQFNYSKYYLEREFKKCYGIGLISYRNAKRMQIAAEMLRNEKVSTVVEKMHFSSVYSFSRSFKKHFGVSPTEYAKSS